MASRALSWVFRGCGIAPSGTRSDKYFTALFLVALSLSSYSIVIRKLHTPDRLYKICHLVGVALSRISVIFMAVYSSLFPQSSLRISCNLMAIDKQLHDIGILKYQPMMTQTYVLFYLGLGSAAILLLSMGEGFLYCISAAVNNILLNAPLCQEIIIAGMIHSRFSAINDHLTRIVSNQNTEGNFQFDSVFRIHTYLQSVVLDVDLHYCFYNLFRFTARFCYTVFNMYEYFIFINYDQSYIIYYPLIFYCVPTTYFVCQAIVCHACSQEAHRTVLLAHRVLQPHTPYNLWGEVELFSTLSTGNNVYFTFGGIFTLDRALVTNTALTALAYLIIAVQLKDIAPFQHVTSSTTSIVAVNATN